MGRSPSIRPAIACFKVPDASPGAASHYGSAPIPRSALIAERVSALLSSSNRAGGAHVSTSPSSPAMGQEQRLSRHWLRPADAPQDRISTAAFDAGRDSWRMRSMIVWRPSRRAVNPDASGRLPILTARSPLCQKIHRLAFERHVEGSTEWASAKAKSAGAMTKMPNSGGTLIRTDPPGSVRVAARSTSTRSISSRDWRQTLK